MTETLAPQLSRLEWDVIDALPYVAVLAGIHDDHKSHRQGGDVARWGSIRTLVRHMANYVTAATLVEQTSHPVNTLLDVGCGTAALSAWLADRLSAELHVQDQDAQVLELAVEAFRPRSVSVPLTDAPQADLVTVLEVVEHIPYSLQRDFLEQAFSRVKPGGFLVVSTPDETSYPLGTSAYPPHVGTLSLARFKRLLYDATGRTPLVWRLEGGAFHLSATRKYCEWFGNHLLRHRAAQRSMHLVPRGVLQHRRGGHRLRRLSDVRVGGLTGSGTGLIGLLH
jgi:SAM-dependent methyltransferase